MNKMPVKVVSLALAVSMLMPLAACGKKKAKNGSRSGVKITADMPWYDAKKLDVEVELDQSQKVEYTYNRLAGADDDYLVVITTGNYRIPDDFDWNKYNYNDYAIAMLTVVDRKTCETNLTIDLTDSISDNEFIEDASYSNGTVTAILSSYDEYTYEMVRKEVDYDVETGKQTDTREEEFGDSNIENTFQLGDYKVDTEMHWEDEAWYTLYIRSADGSRKEVEIKEAGKEYYDIPVIFLLNEGKALVPVTSDTSDKYYFELDLATGTVTELDAKDYEWLDISNIYSSFSGSDNKVYYTTSTGISTINFKEKKTEEVFNYSWCGVSRSKLSSLEIASFSDDAFILCGEDYSSSAFSSRYESDFIIYEFTKAAKNPHAGKTILELYSAWGYTEDKVSDALLKFNETNEDYFIDVTDRYSSNDYSAFDDVNSDDEYEEVQLNVDSELSNQLAMDILNGEGPDILMNVSSYGQLNSTNYLADLSKYVGDLDPEKYFTNVLDAAKVDGKLYNLPVCFSIEGIHTDAKYAGSSGVGFTTAEYEKFLNETLNGKDVIPSGQAIYFAKLFNNMSDKFIANGKADFTGADFESLAEFVKNNVPESSGSWDDAVVYADDEYYETAYAVGASVFKGDRGYEEQVACYAYCYGFSSYISDMSMLNGATAILGIPSSDGRGPMVAPYTSIAISAQACDVDACGEFVKMILSDDVQLDLAMNDNFVLSREAFRAVGKKAVDYYNGEGKYEIMSYDWATGEPLDNRINVTEQTVTDLENIILSCSKMTSTDAAINLILIEEMPAYFSGQKPLSDVVTIAQDRAQKVLDERG